MSSRETTAATRSRLLEFAQLRKAGPALVRGTFTLSFHSAKRAANPGLQPTLLRAPPTRCRPWPDISLSPSRCLAGFFEPTRQHQDGREFRQGVRLHLRRIAFQRKLDRRPRERLRFGEVSGAGKDRRADRTP